MKSCVGVSLLMHICLASIFAYMTGRDLSRIRKSEVVYFLDLSPSCPVNVAKPSKPVVRSASQPVNKILAPPSVTSAAKEVAQKPMPTPIRDTLTTVAQPRTDAGRTDDTDSILTGKHAASSVSAGSGGRNEKVEGAPLSIKAAGSGEAVETEFGSASGPSFLVRTLPAYPMVARRFNREGKVVLRLTIDAKGSLTAVEVLEDPGHGFAAAAVEAVRKSRFNPAYREGRPIIAKAILPVRFSLKGIN